MRGRDKRGEGGVLSSDGGGLAPPADDTLEQGAMTGPTEGVARGAMGFDGTTAVAASIGLE